MKMQKTIENNAMTGGSDVKVPKNDGIPAVQNDLNQTGGTDMAVNGQAGLQEFETLQNSSQVDMGNIKSRDLGNMLSGELVRIGEAVVRAKHPDADFGNLPSRALPTLGKAVIEAASGASAKSQSQVPGNASGQAVTSTVQSQSQTSIPVQGE